VKVVNDVSGSQVQGGEKARKPIKWGGLGADRQRKAGGEGGQNREGV